MGSGLVYHNSTLLAKVEKDLISNEGLNSVFRRLYARQLADGDEFVTSMWKRVQPSLGLSLSTQGLDKIGKVCDWAVVRLRLRKLLCDTKEGIEVSVCAHG